MQQSPHLAVAAKDYMSAAPAVSTIGAALLNKFFAVKMQATRASVSGSGVELNVVYKVR